MAGSATGIHGPLLHIMCLASFCLPDDTMNRSHIYVKAYNLQSDPVVWSRRLVYIAHTLESQFTGLVSLANVIALQRNDMSHPIMHLVRKVSQLCEGD